MHLSSTILEFFTDFPKQYSSLTEYTSLPGTYLMRVEKGPTWESCPVILHCPLELVLPIQPVKELTFCLGSEHDIA